MTHAEKLQQLFEAALKDSSDLYKPPTRAFPTTLGATKVAVSQPAPGPEPEPELAPVVEVHAGPVVDAGLSDTASAELAALLDEQQQRITGKHRREALISLGVLLALTGGGFAWFSQSPQRAVALKDAIHDVRSCGDVTSMAAKYQAALDKVAVRSKQIDQAAEAMGASSNQHAAKAPNMDAEMLAMMGGEGKTTDPRNPLVQEKLAARTAADEATAREPEATMTDDDSFR